MTIELPESARRVQRYLEERGVSLRVVELPASTRTAVEAAAAIGCEVASIAKSVVFRAASSGRSVLVVASGAHRVDESAVAALLGEPLAKATPDFVREKTGYAIGGVPPVAHAEEPVTFIDESLLGLASIWAAAGTPMSVFELTPSELVRLTGGKVVSVAGDGKVGR